MKKMLCLSLMVFFALAPSALTQTTGKPKKPDDFDRLDGRGKSAVRVDVIEWGGNLELHVYPFGSTTSLAMKLDKRNKRKPVMVIGYRFKTQPDQQLVRRAILSIPLNDGFKVFKVRDEKEYDKFIISNHEISGNVYAVTLEPGPKQLYPDGHPALETKDPETKTATSSRKPQAGFYTSPEDQRRPADKPVDETGTIKPFRW